MLFMRQAPPNNYQPNVNLNNFPPPAAENPSAPQTPSKALYTWKIVGIGIGMIASYIGLGLVLGVITFLLLDFFVDDSLNRVIAVHASDIGSLLAAAIIIPLFYIIVSSKARPLFLYFRPLKVRHVLIAFKYFGFYTLPTVIIFAILYQLGLYTPNGNPYGSELVLSSEIILAFAATVLVAPIIEEIICRGYIFAKLRIRHKFWVAFLISGAIFTLAHFRFGVPELLGLFAGAYFMTRGFEKTRNLWTSIIIHALHNGRILIFGYFL